MLVVASTRGVAADAAVPVGAVVSFIDEDKLPFGVRQEVFISKVPGNRQKRATE